jgi:hypothetical protein
MDKVQFLVGRHLDNACCGQGTRQLDVHVTGHARGTVRDGQDGRGGTVRDGLGYVPGNRLLKQGAKVSVGRNAPSASLFAGTDQFDAKIGTKSGHSGLYE